MAKKRSRKSAPRAGVPTPKRRRVGQRDKGRTEEKKVGEVAFDHEEVVRRISAFVGRNTHASDPSEEVEEDAPGGKKQRKEPLDSIAYLSRYLEHNRSSDASAGVASDVAAEAAITREDVATLLLPWSVSRLMRSAASAPTNDASDAIGASEALAWRTLSGALDLLSPKQSWIKNKGESHEDATPDSPSPTSSHETLLSASFSQSALNRLVPHAARASFASPTASDESSLPTCASNCFVHLVRRHRPPFDNACDGLLREVDALVASAVDNAGVGGDGGPYVVLPAPQANVVAASLATIRSLMESANPKRRFGALSSVEALPRLGRLMRVTATSSDKDATANGNGGADDGNATAPAARLVRDILWEGLFHPVHHVDGFRTMAELRAMPALPDAMVGGDSTAENRPQPPKAGRACFQSNLFASLRSLFSLPAAACEEGEVRRATSNAAATAHLLPLLVRGFFVRVRDAAPPTAGGGEADAALQFRFWCHAMLPALELLFHVSHPSSNASGTLARALLEATSEALGVVLEYDAYLPSYADPDGAHLAFLEFVAAGLLRCTIDADVADHSEGVLALVTSLRCILLLNHRLLHERLSDVVSFACSCLSPTDGDGQLQTSVEANALLAAIVKTYRELRQVGHFLSSTRGAFAAVRPSHSFMNNLLNCGNIVESLAMAYQSCPSGQLHEIWDFFDEWVVAIAHTFVAESTAELSFAVQMFIGFIRNVRANKQNSPELRSLCEKSARASVAKLLGKARTSRLDIVQDSEGNRGILMQCGFDLCGWLVDMHTRSCFWVDDVDADVDGSSFLLSEGDDSDDLNVLSYLRSVAETSVSSEQFKIWEASWSQYYWQSSTEAEELCNIGVPMALRGSLQRLALHRIHQLHSMIYYSNLQENERHADDLQDDHSSSQVLTNEAKMLVKFSLYIASSQLSLRSSSSDTMNDLSESLWSPVAQSLCIWAHYCEAFHAELFLVWLFATICQDNTVTTLPAQVLRLEKAIALTLARDASLYDVSEVMSSFMKVGIRFAFNQFVYGIESKDRPSAEMMTQQSCDMTASCIKLAEKGAIKLSSNRCSVADASRALSLIASAPLELELCNENLALLDRIVGLDILASQVIKRTIDARESTDPHLLSIVCSTKIIAANVLPKILLLPSDIDAPCLENFATRLSQNITGFSNDEGVVSACCDAVREYFSLCIDYHDKEPSLLEHFFAEVESLVASPADIDVVSKAPVLRTVIRTINILDRQHSLSKKVGSSSTSSYSLCMNFVWSVHERLQGTDDSDLDDSNTATVLILNSEVSSFCANHIATMPRTNMMTDNQISAAKESVEKVFKLIECVHQSERTSELVNASRYFFSSMAAVPGFFLECVPSPRVFGHVLAALAQSSKCGEDSPLLDAALCSLIRISDLEQTKFITTSVLQERHGEKRNLAFVIKVFHSLLTCANTQEQHDYISSKCKIFLLLSMGLLRGRMGGRTQFVSNVKLYSATITTLISKKEILLLSGREIAMICCEMSPLFHVGRGRENGVDEGDAVVFKSCCSVVASLIAHYPKQLYGCPSPLFSLLLALLSDILQTNDKQCLTQNCLEYAKVCELLIPHKDIFKKHVVGLLLKYIQALNEGMNPSTKSKLMPSMYALLDMCSEFETRQINAMIDVSSKTLFAPVFQSYRKYYQYHGQT